MTQDLPIQVVWFKRDLRIHDHRPLVEASHAGRVICLYVYEPDLLTSDEYATHHHEFINEALRELDASLQGIGGQLITRQGNVVNILHQIFIKHPFVGLWSHAETGNQITYQRDLAVAAWCRTQRIEWTEHRQDGVVRRLRSRNGWSRRWEKNMRAPLTEKPTGLVKVETVVTESLLSTTDARVAPSPVTQRQTGGEQAGEKVVASFLASRSINYRGDMSSPLTGGDGCSRLSPYLAWGCISMRSVAQQAKARAQELREARKSGSKIPSTWLPSLQSFQSRLRWHCHFMQKLEDEPDLEFRNLCSTFDGMREDDFREDFFAAWCEGRTGYPMVDACMRFLRQTGWLNFRMRAMLMSFACYHLWLHWRRPAVFLGKLFLDFEPGIHFSQVQMQAGTTGINSVRIYSPAKQARDQDPTGAFIRRWVPELSDVPLDRLAEPHLMSVDEQSEARCCIGLDYPAPIVDHRTAYAAARKKIGAYRRKPETRAAAEQVLEKHGSRKGPRDSFPGNAETEKIERQLTLI